MPRLLQAGGPPKALRSRRIQRESTFGRCRYCDAHRPRPSQFLHWDFSGAFRRYSSLNAVTGSTRVARCAGIRHAIIVTNSSVTAATVQRHAVARGDAEEQRFEERGEQQRAADADGDADQAGAHLLPEHQSPARSPVSRRAPCGCRLRACAATPRTRSRRTRRSPPSAAPARQIRSAAPSSNARCRWPPR